MRRTLGVALGVVLVLGACGDDDDPEPAAEDTESESESDSESDGGGDADAYIEAVAASLQDEEDEMAIDDETARCVAAAGVNTIGIDALTEADVTPDELADAESLDELGVEVPDDAAPDMAAALGDCNIGETFAQVLVDSFTAEGSVEMPADAVSCLADNIDEEALGLLLAESLISGSEGSDEDFGALFGPALGACPAVMTELLVGGFAAETGTELPQSARDCISTYVESNAAAVAEGLSGGSTDELFTGLVAACPELSSLAPA